MEIFKGFVEKITSRGGAIIKVELMCLFIFMKGANEVIKANNNNNNGT